MFEVEESPSLKIDTTSLISELDALTEVVRKHYIKRSVYSLVEYGFQKGIGVNRMKNFVESKTGEKISYPCIWSIYHDLALKYPNVKHRNQSSESAYQKNAEVVILEEGI